MSHRVCDVLCPRAIVEVVSAWVLPIAVLVANLLPLRTGSDKGFGHHLVDQPGVPLTDGHGRVAVAPNPRAQHPASHGADEQCAGTATLEHVVILGAYSAEIADLIHKLAYD
jgi:hypothetical protein